MVEIDQPANFHTQIGHEAGDVGGADLGVGNPRDRCILQAHREAQHQHGFRQQERDLVVRSAAERAEDQQQQGF